MPVRGDWKSAAAARLQRMGRGDSAKALYGIKDGEGLPPREMTASQMREEGKRRAAKARQPKSFFARLRARFNL